MEDSKQVDVIKDYYIKEIKRFINELELSFDYIDSSAWKGIEKYIKQLEKDADFCKTECDYMYHHLHCFSKDMLYIIDSTSKIKSDAFNFLDNIKLFNNILVFSVFKSENKNTRKTIVKNLYNQIYKSTEAYIKLGTDRNALISELNLQQDIINQLTLDNNNTQEPIDFSNVKLPNLSEIRNIVPGLGDLLNDNSIFGELLQTTLNTLKSGQVNPMSMMNSILQGNTSDPMLKKIMDDMNNTVSTKISQGEITEQELMNTMMSSMSNIKSSLSDAVLNDIGIDKDSPLTEDSLRKTLYNLNKIKDNRYK